MVIEAYENLVSAIASEFARKYKMVEASDLRQELWIWFLTHPNKVKHWEDTLNHKQATKLVARSLRNASKDYCQKEKAATLGYRVEDNYYYDKELLEAILPAVLTGDRNAPSTDNLSFTNTKKVASEGNNWFAMCADVEKALGKLVKEQYWIINLCYGLGMDSAAVSVEMDISQDAVRMRKNRALNNLLNILGGERPRRERDYTGQENDVERTSDEQFLDSE
jgi:hypothetical protein